MIGWLLRLLGLGGRPAAARTAAAPAPHPVVVPSQLSPEQLKLQRRQVVAYIARARMPIRQAAAARQLWIQDLSKVYEAIRSSPTQLILERAGEVGSRHEPAFRDALSMAQGLAPPPACEACHDALIGWLTSLHAACLALMAARRLKDRSLLGSFRENLSQARRQAATLAAERAKLFTVWQLRVRPGIQRRRRAARRPMRRTRTNHPIPTSGAHPHRHRPLAAAVALPRAAPSVRAHAAPPRPAPAPRSSDTAS